LGIVLAIVGCDKASSPPATVPPSPALGPSEGAPSVVSVTAAPSAPSVEPAPASPGPLQSPKAAFVDAPSPEQPFDLCDKVVVAVTSGSVTALGETLGPGDSLLVEWPDPFALGGKGSAVVASVPRARCFYTARPVTTKHIARAAQAPPLAWAGGKMTAHLDLQADVLPELYVGRLAGTMPVAEHTHPGTWEVLCAVEARGTLRLDGEDRRVEPRSCFAVPPDAKHAWQPDDGSKLVAVQLYSPPGPEQRFKKLAADSAAAK
jgi:mannose-6-phosphate isomerase-like protein (cupin superfamily)